MPDDTSISKEAWRICLETLEKVAANPDAALEPEELERLIARLAKSARKRRRKEATRSASREIIEARKESSRRDRRANRIHDRELLGRAGVARVHAGKGHASGHAPGKNLAGPSRALKGKNKTCYCCGASFREVHSFYNRLCVDCGRVNYEKRFEGVDLSGRAALVTGGRIKIGYEIALKLLRDGARVVVTTRFPRDAAMRYAAEKDFHEFSHRLEVRGLDLRFAGDVRAFARELKSNPGALDILVNCAAQTIQRPDEFYKREMELEDRDFIALPKAVRSLLPEPAGRALKQSSLPAGAGWELARDRHGQPVDTRETNSWTLKIHEVDAGEMLGALLVNSAAPFVLISELRELFLKSSFARRYIVNVCGLDGRFQAANKSPDHPHVNMSKAALNMITRTCAEQFAADGIYMNSVDTGWITFEGAYSNREKKNAAGLNPPLDETDGAARIYAPIIAGENGNPEYGLLFRNYEPADW